MQNTSIFHTDNTALAIVLSTYGIPWAKENEPDTLVYSKAALDRAGMNLSQAREHDERCARDSKPTIGRRRYFFGDHPDRAAVVGAFLKTAGTKPDTRIDLPNLTPTDYGTMGALILMNRKTIMANQRLTPAKIEFERADGTSAVVGKNATPESLARLGLK